MHRIVLDSDIGTDVDDLLALAMVPGRPDVDLAAVTVVYGDTDLRARLAATACRGIGLDVPVRRGVGQPLSGREVMWAGLEGEGWTASTPRAMTTATPSACSSSWPRSRRAPSTSWWSAR